MARFCRECGKELREKAQFCGGCGAKTQVAPVAPTVLPSVPSVHAAEPNITSASPGVRTAPPPPPPGSTQTLPTAFTPFPGQTIPQVVSAPMAELSESGSSLVLKGRELAAGFHKFVPPNTQIGSILDRCIRATFLDPDVYRLAALDPKQTTDAGAVAAASLLCVSAGPAILGVLGGGFNLTWILGLLVVQIAGFAAFVVGASYSASFVAGKKVDPLVLFRSVAWGQAIGVLGILPVVGSLISLWRIPTTVVAIRDGLDLDLTKAIILAVIGAVCGAIASAVLTPIVFGLLGGGRGFF